MSKPLYTISLRAPRIVLAVALGVTAVLGFYAGQIRIDSAVANLLPDRDPETAYYHEVSHTFGGEEVTLIGVFADDVFAPTTLAKIERISETVAALDGVRDVVSLTTAEGAEMTDLGLRIGRLFTDAPSAGGEARGLRDKLLGNTLHLENIVSADATAAGILVFFESVDDEVTQRAIDEEIRRLATVLAGPEQIAVTGLPAVKAAFTRLMERDIMRFTPLSILVITLTLALAFRSGRIVLAPLAAVIAAVIWTIAAMVLTGTAINVGTLVLTPLLLSIGIAYAIHIINRYVEELAAGRPHREAIPSAMEQIRFPFAIAVLTTICGFATFIPTSIPALNQFGIYSVFGLVAISVSCLTILPAMLLLLPPPGAHVTGRRKDGRVAHALAGIGRTAVRHRKLVLILAGLVCLASLDGVRRIRVDTDYLSFFSPTSSIRVDNAAVARRLAGAHAVYIVVDGERPGIAARIETLGALRALQEFAVSEDKVDKTVSLLDYLNVLRRTLELEDADGVPTDQAQVDQLLSLIDPADIRDFVNPDHSSTNVVVRTELSGSSEVRTFVERIRDFADKRLPPGLTAHPTGMLMLLAQSSDRLARYQVIGLVQVILALLVLMSFLFLSVRVALLSLIPNIIPILILFALMGWIGIDLNISTSLTAAIVIGLAIDDTVHFLSCFKREARRSGSQEQATMHAMHTVGRPIVFSSLALAAGFLLVCTSSFKPIQHFGALAATTMVVALLTDLLVLPALVTTTPFITLWDLMFLKLGPEPHKQIPLFAGLRPFQARIVVLMGRLESVPAGSFVTRRGESRDELYILLYGRAEVHLPNYDRAFRTIGRGGCVGEMGVVRGRPRSADVIALEDLEYLVFDQHFLRRLRVRHPRIAATVFLNLTRILSERLETTTDQLALTASEVELAGERNSR